MNEQEFRNLKKSIELRAHELDKLQKLYKAETGQEYVVPLYLKEKKFNKMKSQSYN